MCYRADVGGGCTERGCMCVTELTFYVVALVWMSVCYRADV